MICYAIKNEDNRYLAIGQDYAHYWVDDISYAYFFRELPGHSTKELAEQYRDA